MSGNNIYHDLLVEWSMTERAQEIIGKFDESQDWALLDFANWLDERNCFDKEYAMDENKLREMATKWVCPNGFATTPYEFGAINNLMNFGRAILAADGKEIAHDNICKCLRKFPVTTAGVCPNCLCKRRVPN